MPILGKGVGPEGSMELDVLSETPWVVYPVPSEGKIRLRGSDGIRRAILYAEDMTGRTVLTHTWVHENSGMLGSKEITWDVSELAEGTYYLRVESIDPVMPSGIKSRLRFQIAR